MSWLPVQSAVQLDNRIESLFTAYVFGAFQQSSKALAASTSVTFCPFALKKSTVLARDAVGMPCLGTPGHISQVADLYFPASFLDLPTDRQTDWC